MLDEHAAGLYAGGLILTKAVLFLPQFVVVIAFPSMASAAERPAVYLMGLAWWPRSARSPPSARVLSDLAIIFVGGDRSTPRSSR